MKDISLQTIQTVRQSLCGDCGADCSHPEQCDEFVAACEEMEGEDD